MIYNNTCYDPHQYITSLKKRYKKGLSLHVPQQTGRLVTVEELLNPQLDLGECEDPMVLALVASRDPMVTLSMAATTRLSPLAIKHALMSGIFTLVGDVSKHEDVKDCVYFVVKEGFKPSTIDALKNQVISKICYKRKQYRTLIKEGLEKLIKGKIDGATFIKVFFEGMNQLNLKNRAYAKMVSDFILSARFRPKVKILMLENLYKMPREVRLQLMMTLCHAKQEGHTPALRDELICLLKDDPNLVAEPANVNATAKLLTSHYDNFINHKTLKKDPALLAASAIL